MENMKDFYDEKTGNFMYEPNSKEFWEKAIEEKKSKKIITGKVIAINYNGLIVDYNGLRTFMPTKDISINNTTSFEQYLNKDIDFIISSIDIANSKISVSHKEIDLLELENQRKKLIESITVGHIYHGKVLRLKDFGAFVEIQDKIVGLVHISQISHNKIKSVDSALNVGQEVDVKVIKNENGKISLSLKALEKKETDSNEEISEEKEYKKFLKDTGTASTSLSDLLDKLL